MVLRLKETAVKATRSKHSHRDFQLSKFNFSSMSSLATTKMGTAQHSATNRVRYARWLFYPFILILTTFAVFNIYTASASKKMPPHQIFDQEHYEIKSCLSTDLQEHERVTCRFYGLMIDAGSTGTRIHIFEFSHDTKNPASPFKLENEIFMEVKPGLSDYAQRPVEVRIFQFLLWV